MSSEPLLFPENTLSLESRGRLRMSTQMVSSPKAPSHSRVTHLQSVLTHSIQHSQGQGVQHTSFVTHPEVSLCINPAVLTFILFQDWLLAHWLALDLKA